MFHLRCGVLCSLLVALLLGVLPLAIHAGQPAKNPVSLQLQVDDRNVVGWISGTKQYTGQEVAVRLGNDTHTVRVQPGNVFSWPYSIQAQTEVVFNIDDMQQRITLSPPAALEPTVFFVIDRTVYRPQQKLQFAAFLRKLNAMGQFIPIPNQQVAVRIVSEKKQTTAAELALVSDAQGRITGSYQFTDGDVLDNYLISITGYQGSARVTLAEFRKSKIRLDINSTVDGSTMKVNFAALDFLEKAVPGSKLRFTMQVMRKPTITVKHTLKEEEFAYFKQLNLMLPDPETFTIEDLLLYQAEPLYLPVQNFFGSWVLGQFTGDLAMPDGKAVYPLPLDKDWLDGKHVLLVQGVLVDANGREQRASREIPLGQGKQAAKKIVEERTYRAGEKISILQDEVLDLPDNARVTPSLVAMRLSPGNQQPVYSPYFSSGYYDNYDNWLIDANQQSNFSISSSHAYIPLRRRYRPVYQLPGAAQRTIVTAAAFRDGVAELSLPEPGAYVLIAMAQLPDGTTTRGEAYCLVVDEDVQPALSLVIDKTEFSAGDTLTGEIRSRFADARVLVTLRDNTGIRWMKTLQLKGETARISHELERNLSYGCSLDVQYVEEGRSFLAEQFFRVIPKDRMLEIKTQMKEVVDAGEQVKIDISVNRDEPVDLIVSVYDQSLLGIAQDKSANIRDFYLADGRLRNTKDRELLRRRLAGMTLGEAMAKARLLLKDETLDKNSPEYRMLQQAMNDINNGYLRLSSAVSLLNCAGIPARAYTYHGYYSGNWNHRLDKEKADQLLLFDIIDKSEAAYRPVYRFLDEMLVVAESYPGAMPSQYLWNSQDVYARNFNGFLARGEASANSSLSITSGQAFYSHLPGMDVPQPIDVEPDNSGVAVRRDFSDSAYWNALVRTDNHGQATVEFKLPDSLTNWQVVVTAVSRDMQVGTHKAKFTSTKPIMVWPMLPRLFTEGDTVDIYASVHNRTEKDQTIQVNCKVDNGELLTDAKTKIFVKAGENKPVYWTYRPACAGFTQILMVAECPAGSDASLKRLPVVSSGAEEVITASGFCKGSVTVAMPQGADPSRASLEVSLAPTLVADLADTLNYLVDYPHGCVEQTMSRFLPAIKVAQVLKSYEIENTALKEKLPACVDMGIKRLLELQQPDGGWGWNGNSQTHEMMTPYALYGLLEAEKAGYKINNETAIERGLGRLKGFIDAMGEKQAADRIYCMSVYAHRKKIEDAWWTFITDQLAKKQLSDYATALALEMAVENKKKELAGSLAASLRASAQQGAGLVSWKTAGFSRWGDDPNEITAMALKALVAYDDNDSLIPGTLAFFAQGKRGNRWNSTKDTAMIVYAMCDYVTHQQVDAKGAKTITMAVNGGEKTLVEFANGLTKKLTIPGENLRHGDNVISFANASPGMMYRISLRYYHTGKDLPPKDNGITVTRKFYLLDDNGGQVRELKPGDTVPRGAYVRSDVTAFYKAGINMRYVLVEDPKPSCAEILPADDIRFRTNSSPYVLREDKLGSVFYHHESTPSAIVDRCVWHAELSGTFIIPPASVELMYQTEIRGHSGTFYFTVKDREK